MAGTLAKLMAKLGLDTSEFDRGLEKAERGATAFGGKMNTGFAAALSKMTGLGTAFIGGFAGGLAGGAISAAFDAISGNIRETVRGVAELGDEAKKSALGIQGFQEWKFVAEQNRVSIDALTDGFKELSLRADEWIKTGSGSGAESFQRLGFTADDLAKRLKNPSDLMLEIVRRLQRFDQAARIRIMDELFGGTGGEQFVQLIDQGTEGLQKTIDKAHEVGAVLDTEMIEKAQEIDQKWDALTSRVTNFSKKVAVELADIPFDLVETRIDDLFSSEKIGRSILGDETYDALRKMGDLADKNLAAVKAGAAAGGVLGAGLAAAATSSSPLVDKLETLSTLYAHLSDAAQDTSVQLASAATTADQLGNDALWGALAQASTDMRALSDDFANGAVSGEDFAEGMQAIRDRAASALDSLDGIDKAQFSGVIASLGGLGNKLVDLIGKARALKETLPGVTALGGLEDADKAGSRSALAELNAQIAAKRAFLTLEDQQNSKSAEQLRLDKAIADFRTRAKKAGVTVTDAEAEAGGRAALAADKDRAPTPKGSTRSSTRKSAADMIAEIAQQTSALNAESQALLEAAGSGEIYGDKAEYAATKAKLLTALQQEGIQITPELAAKVEAVAQAYGQAAQSTDEAREKLEALQAETERGEDALNDLFGSVLDGSDAAAKAVAELLAQIAKVQFAKGMLGLLGGTGSSISTVLGSLLGANANGTDNWSGGLTKVNERGGEIMNLPRGTQIIPHDVSMRMADAAGSAAGGGASAMHVTVGFDSTGNLYVRQVAQQEAASAVAAGNQALPGRIQTINANPRRR